MPADASESSPGREPPETKGQKVTLKRPKTIKAGRKITFGKGKKKTSMAARPFSRVG